MKKILSVMLSVAMLLGFAMMSPVSVSAASSESAVEGYYTYTVTDGEATITGVDEDISGNVTIPATLGGYPVTVIYGSAFKDCTGITSVVIPHGVTAINYRAFYGCTALESISIPDSVTTIGDGVFFNTAFYNNTANWENNALYIGEYLIKVNKNATGSYVIKDGTKIIVENAVAYSNLTSVKLPDTLTRIGRHAFFGSGSLEKINIPSSVEYIGGGV